MCPAKIGIGILYNPALADFLRTDLDCVDYLEIIPDMFWVGRNREGQYAELESWVEVLDGVAAKRPIVAHHTGLSLGSAGDFDLTRVDRVAEWHDRYQYRWHSEHLSFVRITDGGGHDHNAGLAVPVPYDQELLDLMSGRIEGVLRRVPIPFLIENGVYFAEFPEQEMSEPAFLNRLSERTGCGLLLDLHNLYTNARNHGFDAFAFLDELELDRVGEIHIAGGSEMAGMYTDSHAGPVADPVWGLLERVVPSAPNLAGITFEFHDSYFPMLKTEGVRGELTRAAEVWHAHR